MSKKTFLIVISILLALVKQYECQIVWNLTQKLEIKQIKQFTKKVIEVGEVLTINFDDYFKGSLLKYEYALYDSLGRDKTQNLSNWVYSFQAFDQMKNQSLNIEGDRRDPFPRSTENFKDLSSNLNDLFIIDKSFVFYKYDLSVTIQGEIQQKWNISLNTSIVNRICTDVTHFSPYQQIESVIMFCQGQQFNLSDPGKDPKISYYIVIVDNMRIVKSRNTKSSQSMSSEIIDSPTVRYLEYQPGPTTPDLIEEYGVRYNRFIWDEAPRIPFQIEYMALKKDNITQQPQIYSIILDLTMLKEMRDENLTYFNFTDSSQLFQINEYINIAQGFKINNIQDYMVLNLPIERRSLLAVLYEGEGLLVCFINQTFLGNPVVPRVYNCNETSMTQMITFNSMLSLHYNLDDIKHAKNRFYATLSTPPGVLEIDFSDPYNVYSMSLYVINEVTSRYVGRNVLGVNNKYIAHLMEDIVTGHQFLRIYNRQEDFYTLAIVDYPLSKERKSNFFVFPSYTIDILFFRDERFTYIYNIDQPKLMINAKNYFWMEKMIRFGNQFTIAAKVSNPQSSINFNFTFQILVNGSTEIVQIYNNDTKKSNDVFYNCGDPDFKYKVTDFYIGPNYNMSKADRDGCLPEKDFDNACFFRFFDQDLKFQASANFPFRFYCDYEYFLQGMRTDGEESSNENILVCVNYEKSSISSYLFQNIGIKNYNISINISQLNTITIRHLQFNKVIFDTNDRVLVVFGDVKVDPWIRNVSEVHYIQVLQQLNWQSYQSSTLTFPAETILSIAYNSQLNRGIVTSVAYDCNQDARKCQNQTLFELDFEFNTVQILFSKVLVLDAKLRGTILLTKISDSGFIFNVGERYTIDIYEIVEYGLYTLDFQAYPDLVNTFSIYFDMESVGVLVNSDKIIDFAIYGNKYMIFFLQSGKSFVYKIVQNINLQFKMSIILYDKYQNFTLSRSVHAIVVKTMINNFLFLLMQDEKDVYVLVYDLESPQHGSFVMAQKIDSIPIESEKKRASYTTQNEWNNEMLFISDGRISLYYVYFYNYLTIQNRPLLQNRLIQNCENMKVNSLEGGYDERPQEFAKIQIYPSSNFESQNQTIDCINLTVLAQNQGLVISSYEGQSLFNYTYSDEIKDFNQMPSSILMESMLEGFSQNFQVACSFENEDFEIESCDDFVSAKAGNIIYQYSIESVTMSQQIRFQFPMYPYYMMLDTKYFMCVYYLPEFSTNLSSTTGRPLSQLKQASQPQDQVLNCQVTGYAKSFKLTDDFNINFSNSDNVKSYLLAYQCNYDRINNTLKLAIVQVSSDHTSTFDKAQAFKLVVINGEYLIKNPVLDIVLVNASLQEDSLQLILATTSVHEFSYTNMLVIQRVKVNLTSNTTEFAFLDASQAITANKNTFKVTKMQVIPESSLIVVVSQYEGALIYDVQNLMIVAEIKSSQDDPYYFQEANQLGDLFIFSVALNKPNVINLITNHGFYFYYYDVDLWNRTQIFPDFKKNLQPVSQRIIRFQFDEFDQDIAMNDYGYAFLMTRRNDTGSFYVYLGAVSFYAAINNKIFSQQLIIKNQICSSLTQQTDMDQNYPEDMIIVNFVCGSELYIVRITLRPYISFNLEELEKYGTRKNPDTGIVQTGTTQFNQFNVVINSSNTYSNKSVNILVEYYSAERPTSIIVLTWLGILVLIAAIFILKISYLLSDQAQKKDPQAKLETLQSVFALRTTINASVLTMTASALDRTDNFGDLSRQDSSELPNDESDDTYSNNLKRNHQTSDFSRLDLQVFELRQTSSSLMKSKNSKKTIKSQQKQSYQSKSKNQADLQDIQEQVILEKDFKERYSVFDRFNEQKKTYLEQDDKDFQFVQVQSRHTEQKHSKGSNFWFFRNKSQPKVEQKTEQEKNKVSANLEEILDTFNQE